MKRFEEPEMLVQYFDIEDVITTSSDVPPVSSDGPTLGDNEIPFG